MTRNHAELWKKHSKSRRCPFLILLGLMLSPSFAKLISNGAILPFASKIGLKQHDFRFGSQLPWVLRGVDLVIRGGSRTVFIWTTDKGKSALLDVIMGLLPPKPRILAIDGVPVTPHNQKNGKRI